MCDDLKNRIVNKAIELFQKYGIKSVSIDDICRELGVSKKTFYSVFGQKDDLVVEVLTWMRETGSKEVEKRITSRSTEDILVHFVREAHKIKDVRDVPPLLFDLKKYYPTLFALYISQIFEDSRKMMEELLQRGINEGVIRKDLDVKMCAFFFAHMHQGIISNTSEVERYVSVKQFMQFVMDLFMRSIISEEGKVMLENILKSK